MPPFTRAEMDIHISNSGKTIDPKCKDHSVPTNLQKAKRFLSDEYLKDVVAASDEKYFYVKSLCHHSFRKNDPPHNLRLALDIITGEVKSSWCSCVAGQVGFCNHVLALMFMLCKYSFFKCGDTSELDNEDDMKPAMACTSTLQMWNNKGRKDKINPQPVMEVLVKKTKLDDSFQSNKIPWVKCLLYEARNAVTFQTESEKVLKEKLTQINPKMPLAQIIRPSSETTDYEDTRFGKSPRGSYGSYQLTFTESNFKVFCDVSSVTRSAPVLTTQEELQ